MKTEGCSVPSALTALPQGPHKQFNSLWGHGLNTLQAFFSNIPSAHAASSGLPSGHVPLKNFLSVPVVFQGVLLGQIALANSDREYTQSDLENIGRLGDFYAVILQNQRHEKIMRENEARFRMMVDVAPFPLLLTSLVDQSVLYLNRLAADLFHVVQEEAIGQKAPDFYRNPEQRAEIIQEVLDTGAALDRELELLDNAGKTFWVILSVVKVEWDGQPAILVALNDINARKLLEEELRRLATTDYLTGMWNRRHFMVLANKELMRRWRYERPFSLIMFDLDHFKEVNDTFGHLAGDQVLAEVASLAAKELRKVDFAGRLGGEEFALLLPETAIDKAVQVADRIRRSIASCGFMLEDGNVVKLTASFGVAEALQADEKFDIVINRSDYALYQSKKAGRNKVTAYAEE